MPSHQELDGAALHEDGEEDHGERGGQEELLVPAGVVEDRRQGKPNCSSFFFEVRSHSEKRKQKSPPQPESSVGDDDLLLPADPVGAELVHHRREQDGDQEPEILSEDSIFIMVMISKVVIRNLK